MKKRKINKITSLLLSFSFALSNFVGIENVFAANNAVPTITNASFSNNQVSLQWDTPIPSSDIFFTENFETKELDLTRGIYTGLSFPVNGYYYDRYGNVHFGKSTSITESLKVLNGYGYNNSKGARAYNTTANNGWYYNWYNYLPTPAPATSSVMTFYDWKQVKTDRPAILRAKTKGAGSFNMNGYGGWVGTSVQNPSLKWAETLSSSEFYNRLQNGQRIEILNPYGLTEDRYHLATAVCDNYSYNFYLSVGQLYSENGKWYFHPREWYGAWNGDAKPGQVVAGSNRNITPPVYGQPLINLTGWQGGMYKTMSVNANDWTNISGNLHIPYNSMIEAVGNYYVFTLDMSTQNTLYLDDIQIAYAPLSKVYRDGQLIMNSNYTVEFTDTTAKDYVAPNTPNVSQSISGSNITFSWPHVQDNGNVYNYQVTSVNAYGEESARSSTKTVYATSGVKNYEIYINGSLYTTTTNNSITISNGFEVNNVQVRAVDNVGNKSGFSTPLNQFKLRTFKLTDGVQLAWDYGSLSKDGAYKIYRKDNHSDDFQPIQAKETVKVLQVHPYTNNLQNWVSQYGQGKISCDSVSIESFNSNPNQIWNYDVVVFGFWDSNNGKDITSNTVPILQSFLNSGRGVLFGHDTLRDAFPNFAKLAPYVNLDTSGGPAYSVEDKIKIDKKGLLTKYPYDIGDIGTVLSIPAAHALMQLPHGENWMTFLNSNQYYLTTWNNAAMIQTGHSGGQATPDEQKLIMNTLFYLAQLTSETSWLDKSAIDIDAPTIPEITGTSKSGNNIIVNYKAATDNGTTYNYKIETNRNNTSVLSNISSQTITSGLKHYEIYVNGKLYGTTNATSYTLPNTYDINNIQVRAVDNAGNKSTFSNSINEFKLQSSKVTNGVQLDWNYGSETNNSAYKIYRKDNHTADFQPIQAKENVKVLEVYPLSSKVPKWAASYGQGKISVDAVKLSDFNINPQGYLKENNQWKYDVVVFGFADCNGYCSTEGDMTSTAAVLMEQFIKDGRGVLFGHDTIHPSKPNFNILAPYANVLPSTNSEVAISPSNPANTITITKKGLLTKYPWNIGDIGTVLSVPNTHVSQIANGEVWMNFNTSTTGVLPKSKDIYLATYNNTAMIQTGHSTNAETVDEQKLVMNTIFYLAQLTSETSWLDKSALDIDGPTIPTVNNVDISGNKATVHFNKSTDNGTTYDYKIGTNKNNSEVFSNVSTQTITSGMKTYEVYVNDTLIGMTGNNSYTFTIPNASQGFSVKVVAVDNAGNKSDNAYEKDGGIKLTATPNPQENYIKLDWTKPSVNQEYTYMVYQKRPDSQEFQTIPTKDAVKVLNIYPTASGIPTETFTNWKGQTFTISKAANLKRWMEEPNAENPKGYGKGLIDVDVISLQEFNQNPNMIWNYDVVYHGHWDANAGVGNNIFSDTSLSIINQFIDSGRGFLGGHDTIGFDYGDTSLSKLRNKFNVKIGYWSSPLPNVDFNQGWGMAGNKISVVKKGLLTNYPWVIGDNLTVPWTHSTSNMAFGDIWMNIDGTYSSGLPPTGYEKYSGYYLTTWNNTAMVQTGHSSGQATPDEQKLLANTLFYLAQVTSANSWNDRMGQDVTNPTQPTFKSNSINGNTSQVTFTINPSTDNGTTYQYYVEGKGLSDGKTYLSDTVVTSITTGLKGYSYVIDNNPATVPDNIVDTTSTTITKTVDLTKPIYLHIVAVDNVGNKSDVLHYKVEDTTPPTATHTISPNTWTNQNVTINVTASDVGYGVKRIKKPDGTYVNGSTASYVVSTNGAYNFVIEDYAGNITNYPVTITNIDKVNPTGSFTINNGATQTNDRNVTLKINYNDNLSGVYKIAIRENGVTKEYTPTSSPFTTTWTVSPAAGTKVFYVTLYDRAGNTTVLTNSIIYTNLEIQNFILTNVVNPKVFNSSNPFMPKSWVFSPQSMSAGGNISFQLTLSTPVDLPNYTDTVTYKLKLTHANGYNVTLSGNMIKGSGLTYSSKITIPQNTPKDTKVELVVTATRQTSEFIETVYFPTKTSNIDFAHIGYVTNNINEEIKFNEIK